MADDSLDAYTARCTRAGLDVQAATRVGTQVCVVVASVPQSASGLAGLTQRLGVGVTVSVAADGTVAAWFGDGHARTRR